MEGSRKGASLSVGALLGEPFLGIWKDTGRRAQGTGITLREGLAGEPVRGLIYRGLEKALYMGISPHRGPVENHEGVHSPGTLKNSWRRALEMDHLSLWALCETNLEKGLLYWGP